MEHKHHDSSSRNIKNSMNQNSNEHSSAEGDDHEHTTENGSKIYDHHRKRNKSSGFSLKAAGLEDA